MFVAPLWVSTSILLMCDGVGNAQSEFLRVENFRGLGTGTTNGPLEVILRSWGWSAVPKVAWVDLVDPHLLGMIRHSYSHQRSLTAK